jgi:phosphoribosylglycinamide formyltransferase-1
MEAILSAIHRGIIRNARPVIVLSNVQKANGLTVAKEKFGVRTGVLSNDDRLKGWDYDKNILSILRKYKISPRNGLICLAGFMRLLSPKFVSIFRNRIINIHPSLLPSFPGLHAQRQALEYGVKISGCTVHFVDQGLDTGPIIIQKSTPVLESDTEETLSERILEDEHKIYPEAIRLISENKVKLLRRKVLVQSQ